MSSKRYVKINASDNINYKEKNSPTNQLIKFGTDDVLRPRNSQFSFRNRSEDSAERKGKSDVEKVVVSLWVKTAVTGNLEKLLKNTLANFDVMPVGKIGTLWESLHIEMTRIVDGYDFLDGFTLRAHIYKSIGRKANDDTLLIYLIDNYGLSLRIISLNTDFKAITYGLQSSMKIQLLHIGYKHFMPLLPININESYELSEGDKELLANIKASDPNNNNSQQIENEKHLLTQLREILQGKERAQDFIDIPRTNNKNKPYYDVFPIEELDNNPDLKIGTLHIRHAQFATATQIKNNGGKEIEADTEKEKETETKKELETRKEKEREKIIDKETKKEISLMNRKNCGYNAFDGDIVYVEINDRKNGTGKVLGVKSSHHKPMNSIYICKVNRDQGSHMMPLDGTFPKIRVDNEPGRRLYEKELQQKTGKTFKKEQRPFEMERQENRNYADNIYVSIFTLQYDKIKEIAEFPDNQIKRFDPETCDKLFLVCYQYWDISYMYPYGKVVGMISTYDSFKDSLHLILPLCKIEPTIINSIYRKEIKTIKQLVKVVKDVPHDIVPADAMVFTMDNEETRDMDDALSYHVKDNMIVVGVHITDITRYISPQHEIYKQAQRRYATAYIPKKLGVDPVYLVEKSLSTYALSLVPNQPRAVLSVMFYFTMTSPRVITNVTFHETVIKSKYKLNYQQVEEWIKETETPADVKEDLFIAIKQCHEIAKEVRRARLPHSYFVRQSNYKKPNFAFDDSCNAQFLIEEFMIMANENVAKKIYERYPNMSLIFVQDPVTDYDQWEERLFEHMNMRFPSSLKQYCNLLNIRRNSENRRDLIVSLQYYDDFVKYVREDLNKARNMLQYDEYINDIYVHLTEWYGISPSARYECSAAKIIDNRHFSLDKDIYTHFTSPMRRFTDVIVHRMLKSIINPSLSIDSIDENTIEEVCAIANQRLKNKKLFKKCCSPYAIFESSPSLYNFVLDCACTNITNEELHFVHPSLERSSSIQSIKFSQLSLCAAPTELQGLQSATFCNLKWKKIIYSDDPQNERPPNRIFVISNQLYAARLPNSGLELLSNIRDSTIESDNYDSKLLELVSKFQKNESTIKIFSFYTSEPIIEIQLHVCIKTILRIQFCSYKVNGLKRILPELLIVHPSLQLCLLHKEDPVMCFVPGGKLELKNNNIIWHFKNVKEYQDHFTPLIQMESLKEIMSEKSKFTFLDVPISWMNVISPMTKKEEIFGIVNYSNELCELWHIEFSEERDDVRKKFDDIVDESLLSVTGDFVCIHSKMAMGSNYWVGHGAIVNVRKYQKSNNDPIVKVIVFMLIQTDFDIFDDRFSNMKFSVEVYFRSISAKRQLQVVSSIHRHKLLEDIILRKNISPLIKDEELFQRVIARLRDENVYSLNSRQKEALYKAMHQKLSFIWGPPGTGKTSIGCIIAYAYWIKNKDDAVVIYCGPSNECVNLIIHAMTEKFKHKCPKMLRIFSNKQELADFPLPGCPTNCKPLSTIMQEKSLHHLIRTPGASKSLEILRLDTKFQKIRNASISAKYDFEQEKDVEDDCESEDNEYISVHGLIRKYKKLVIEAKKDYIRSNVHNMILCTTSVSASKIMKEFKIKQIIIDEAGMCKEPETLIPILNALNSVDNIVLIGDHKQLRPIILDDLASKRGLQRSLFERYQVDIKRGGETDFRTMLNEQYRMHPSICEFPSKYFYDGKLHTIASDKWTGLHDSHFKDGKDIIKWNGVDYSWAKYGYEDSLRKSSYSAIPDNVWPGKRSIPYTCFQYKSECYPERLVFINVVGDEIVQSVTTSTSGESSRKNMEEVAAVGVVYDKLIKRIISVKGDINSAAEHITVLTQYAFQEEMLLTECKRILVSNRINIEPNVKTVIKSQGSENDYIIFSTVRSLRNKSDIINNPSPGWEKQYLGFIIDPNQVNVALTRARKGLIIIGNKGLLSANKMWGKLLNNLKDRRCVLDDLRDFDKLF